MHATAMNENSMPFLPMRSTGSAADGAAPLPRPAPAAYRPARARRPRSPRRAALRGNRRRYNPCSPSAFRSKYNNSFHFSLLLKTAPAFADLQNAQHASFRFHYTRRAPFCQCPSEKAPRKKGCRRAQQRAPRPIPCRTISGSSTKNRSTCARFPAPTTFSRSRASCRGRKFWHAPARAKRANGWR